MSIRHPSFPAGQERSTITACVSAELAARVRAEAARDNRSMSSQVRHMLEWYLDMRAPQKESTAHDET